MFSQFQTKSHSPNVSVIVQVKCNKTGTVYFQNIKTGETAWRRTDLENPRTRNK